jgi:hypothetical protein
MTQKQALEILKTGANVFLTGEPGAGKTHTIREYIEYLRSYGIEPAVTASTGIAATHVHGMTIHAWSGIGIKKRLSAEEVEAIAGKQHVYKRIERTRVLIIDEISMLSADTLESADAVCRAAKRNPAEAFGGMQVVFVGDFFQLPPVTRSGDAPADFAFDSKTWRDARPLICYLSEQHRQDDPAFLSVLSAIRQDSLSEDHAKHIRARVGSHGGVASGVTRLFSHNEDVDALNLGRLDAIGGDEKVFGMEMLGPAQLAETLKNGCLSPEELRLKIGAVVMCTKNNPAKGFVNGTLGEVTGFAKESGHPIIRTRQGRNIEMEPMEWSLEEGGKVRAKIVQVPLRLAWAITIHKSQGMSMDAAVMDLSGVFEYGQGYVALSRVRRLSGLYLTGYNAKSMAVHPRILAEDGEFRSSSDTAQETFRSLPPHEVASLQKNFIKAIGGTEAERLERSATELLSSRHPRGAKRGRRANPAERREKRWEDTFELIASGMSVEDAAKERGRAAGTILGHLESLKALGKLPLERIAHLATGKEKEMKEMHAAMKKIGPGSLKALFDHFRGTYRYDAIQLARLLYDDAR